MISEEQLKQLMENISVEKETPNASRRPVEEAEAKEILLKNDALNKLKELFEGRGASTRETEEDEIELVKSPLPAGEGSRAYELIRAASKQSPAGESRAMFREILSRLPEKFAEDKPALPPESTLLVKDLIAEYMNEKSNDNSWKEKTATDYLSVLNLFIEVFGDKEIGQIGRKQIVYYRDEILKKLPTNRNKGAKAKMSLPELLADTTMKKLSIPRINNSLVVISGFMDWCANDKKCIKDDPTNGLRLKDRRHSSTKRDIYTDEELERIVVGLSNLKPTPAMKYKHIEWTWITLIGMHQGLRENEICQLGINNIVLIQDTPCFSITEEDIEQYESKKSVKNLNSMRTVPIHNDLLKLGFLEYVNARRECMEKAIRSRKISSEEKERQRQLFPSMTYSASKESFITNFYNFFSKFNSKEVTSNPKATFHSLRHNFASKLNNSSKVNYVVNYLCGHKFTTETDKTYTKPFFQSLYEELARLKFDFDLFEIFDKKPLPVEAIQQQILQLPSQKFYHFGTSD